MIELVERENDRAVTQIIKVMAKLEDKIAFYGQGKSSAHNQISEKFFKTILY